MTGGPRVWATPSQAIQNGACAVCLGGGSTHDVVLGRVGPCSQCGGTGSLDDMLARQCDDPDCPDHPVPDRPDWSRFGLVDMPADDRHRTELRRQPGNPSSWLARCSCGWHGRAQLRRVDAEDDADEHVRLM